MNPIFENKILSLKTWVNLISIAFGNIIPRKYLDFLKKLKK
jgi:hypothetical protein